MSVCKMLVLNLMKECWLASDIVLASSEKNSLCLCHLTLLCFLKESRQILNFDWLSVFCLIDIGVLR